LLFWRAGNPKSAGQDKNLRFLRFLGVTGIPIVNPTIHKSINPLLGPRPPSQVPTGKWDPSQKEAKDAKKNKVITNCDPLRNLRFAKALPLAFTEPGPLMAAMVLSTPRAVAMSVYVIRAFVQMREAQATNAAILKRLAEIDKTLLTHDAALRDIYQKLLPLLTPPPDPPRQEIGFHIKEEAAPYRVKKRPART
jgi:hypothetical protein